MTNKKTIAKIAVFVLIVAFVQSAHIPLVSAPPGTTPKLPGMGTLWPWGIFDYDPTPYVAGYQMSEPGWGGRSQTEKVRITVSFPNTPPPGQTIQDVIPNSWNYIAGGMFLQTVLGTGGPNDNYDYGFAATLSLDHYGNIQYNMGFWETFEGAPDTHGTPVGQYSIRIWDDAIVLPVAPSTPVTLTMEWNGGEVWWYYQIENGDYTLAGIYDAAAYVVANRNPGCTIQESFNIGYHYRGFPWDHGVYDFQFGMYSEEPLLLQNNAYNVNLYHPKYFTNDDRWKCVQEAYTVRGEDSYMDVYWRWGGLLYSGSWARYYGNDGTPGTAPGFEVEFYGDDRPPLLTDFLLWNSPPAPPEKPEYIDGTLYSVAYELCEYSFMSVDPNDDDLTYTFYWGDGSYDTVTELSGKKVSASHAWNSAGDYTIEVKAEDTTGAWTYSDPLVVHVDPPVRNIDTGLRYDTIQEAIDAPETQNGHTIHVAEGTYIEHVVINKRLTIKGEDPITTIIDGRDTGNVITVESDGVSISQFTIQNGDVGICVAQSDSVSISDNIVSGNDGTANSHGMYLYNSNGGSVKRNIVSDNGYDGILLSSCMDNDIINNTVSGGEVGIYLWFSNDNTIKENIVLDNSESSIILYESNYNEILENWLVSREKYGLYLASSRYNIIHHNNFIDNWYGHVRFYQSPSNVWVSINEVGNFWSYHIPKSQKNNYPLAWRWFPGDLDGDGYVGMFDFGIFAQTYPSDMGDPNYNKLADLDYDGDVDMFDYGIFAYYYTKSAPPY